MQLSTASIAIVGMGLMGGSLGKALVRSSGVKQVRALVRNPATAHRAVAGGAADMASTAPARVLADADIVVFATPVRTVVQQLAGMSGFFKPGSVITDMGSVKAAVLEAMDQLPEGIRAVGGHPMCGKETSGLNASDADLFRDRVWVMVRGKKSDPPAMHLVEEMIRSVGARPVIMDAELHDATAACISHLPYLLAVTLVAVAEEESQANDEVWKLASSGFRDTSRVAGGDLTMMMDILATNKENVARMLRNAHGQIDRLLGLIENGDPEKLKSVLSAVRSRRMKLFPGTSPLSPGSADA
jgi:prephenate dehydrogenase